MSCMYTTTGEYTCSVAHDSRESFFQPGVTVFTDFDFKGRSAYRSVGSYSSKSWPWTDGTHNFCPHAPGPLGVDNDAISSIKVDPGYKVTVYEHDNCSGNRRTYFSDQPVIIEMNDSISSYVVEPAPVTVYEHCKSDGLGKSQGFDVGDYKTKDINVVGNKMISAISISPGYSVTVYDSDNFEGKSNRYVNTTKKVKDIDCLTSRSAKNDWNDRISSFKVRKI